jgi:uncharacterized protein YdeI (YjbR/CyaY-like superfamily)
LTDILNKIYLPTREAWREWLAENHCREQEVWLIYYKKHTGRPRVAYNDAVDEALCFGWVDSLVRRLDQDTYAQKFTPRKEDSRWSQHNINRADKLIASGKMTAAGMRKINAAKKNGNWFKPVRVPRFSEVPVELLAALQENEAAQQNFNKLAASYKNQMIGWIVSAKKDETRQRRIREVIGLLEKNKKLGMK